MTTGRFKLSHSDRELLAKAGVCTEEDAPATMERFESYRESELITELAEVSFKNTRLWAELDSSRKRGDNWRLAFWAVAGALVLLVLGGMR